MFLFYCCYDVITIKKGARAVNITQTGDKVVIEMTLEEARELEKACWSAKHYWQRATQEETSEMVREITNRIARKFASMRIELAEVIGY